MPRMGRAVLPDFPRSVGMTGVAIPEWEWHLMRDAVQRGQLTGTDRFVAQVETILGKRIENRSRGRPAKNPLMQHESASK